VLVSALVPAFGRWLCLTGDIVPHGDNAVLSMFMLPTLVLSHGVSSAFMTSDFLINDARLGLCLVRLAGVTAAEGMGYQTASDRNVAMSMRRGTGRAFVAEHARAT